MARSPSTTLAIPALGTTPPAVIVVTSSDTRRVHLFRTRRLRPGIGGGSGEDPATEALRVRIRAALARGALPPLPGPRSWVGRGNGDPCAGCGEPLRSTEMEHEVEVPGQPEPVRVHVKCYLVWKAES